MNRRDENILRSIDFLKEVVCKRFTLFFSQEPNNTLAFPELAIEPDDAPLNYFLVRNKLNIEEYVILQLALMPHVHPTMLDSIVQKFLPNGGDFPEFGGAKVNNCRSMLPTGETAQFVLAGNDIANRLRVMDYFSTEHFFHKQHILALESVKDGEPRMSGRIILQPEYVDLFTLGKVTAPAFSNDFPAKLIETQMTWEDLVLHPTTQGHIEDIRIWLQYNKMLAEDAVLSRKLKKGYRALFYGASGTGKTLTASLLGKQFDKRVYRIDLSQVVSKYIGETEKNLEKIFTKAENRNWILFFDEADALFGKRSSVSSAHDKYANQEVSYLLQRVEDYEGLVVLASNFKNNIDQAFVRRFNAVIHFPTPDAAERLALWNKNAPAMIPIAPEVRLKTYADKFELSGSAIANIMQYATLCALSRDDKQIRDQDMTNGIRRELSKEDKFL